MNYFKIQNIKVNQGKKTFGFLTLKNSISGNIQIPIGMINGSEKGPILCITGGMTGTQYVGIDACIKLYNELDPQKINGKIIILPVCQIFGFQQGIDKSPIDGHDLNSIFPGNQEGTLSYKLAYLLFNEVISKSDFHLDLRGGDSNEIINLFAVSCELGKKDFDYENENLAKSLGTKEYVVYQDVKGRIISECCRSGIHSIILMAHKGLGIYDIDQVDICIKRINNLLKYLNMLEGKTEDSYNQIKMGSIINYIKSEQSGLLNLSETVGKYIEKDRKLGEIINFEGELLQEITSPITGIVNCIFPKYVKKPGEKILGIRKIIQ